MSMPVTIPGSAATGSAAEPIASCLNCPSYSSDVIVNAAKFGKSIGAPMCLRYGRVLGAPNSTEQQLERTAVQVARNCDSFGKHAPSTPVDNGSYMRVALPMPEFRKELDPTAPFVSSCLACQSLVPGQDVLNGLGFPSGLCKAKGKLIMPTQQVNEAKGCEFKHMKMIPTDMEGVRLLPELQGIVTVIGAVDAKSVYKDTKKNFREPTTRETDRAVTDDELIEGIRAWEKISDPEGSGGEVFIPIFMREYFDAEQQKLIPNTGDDEHPEQYVDHQGLSYKAAVLWLYLDETPALHGVAGTGKTEFFRHMAWRMQVPFDRVSITNSTEVEDLMGKMHYSPTEGTYFTYGRLPSAWPRPGVMVIDEPNVGPVDVWQQIRPLTDNSKQMRVDANGGESVGKHKHRYMGMAMNPAWDPRNVGAQVISDADGSRLSHIFVEYPDEELERAIITDRCQVDEYEINVKKLDAIMKIAEALRALSEDSLSVSWGIRQQIKVARSSRYFNLATCYKLAAADYLEPEQQEVILDQVKSFAGRF